MINYVHIDLVLPIVFFGRSRILCEWWEHLLFPILLIPGRALTFVLKHIWPLRILIWYEWSLPLDIRGVYRINILKLWSFWEISMHLLIILFHLDDQMLLFILFFLNQLRWHFHHLTSIQVTLGTWGSIIKPLLNPFNNTLFGIQLHLRGKHTRIIYVICQIYLNTVI